MPRSISKKIAAQDKPILLGIVLLVLLVIVYLFIKVKTSQPDYSVFDGCEQPKVVNTISRYERRGNWGDTHITYIYDCANGGQVESPISPTDLPR